MNWHAFLAMGGYALYVWGSFGVTFALLAVEVLLLVNRRRALVRQMALDGNLHFPNEA